MKSIFFTISVLLAFLSFSFPTLSMDLDSNKQSGGIPKLQVMVVRSKHSSFEKDAENENYVEVEKHRNTSISDQELFFSVPYRPNNLPKILYYLMPPLKTPLNIPLMGYMTYVDLGGISLSEMFKKNPSLFAPLAKSPHLRGLNLDACDLGQYVSAVSLLTNLTELNIEYNECKNPAPFLSPLTNLTCLNLADNSFGENIDNINFLLALKKLRQLNLRSCGISKHLNDLALLPLICLNIGGNPISTLPSLPGLIYLDAKDCSLPQDAPVSRLLPNLQYLDASGRNSNSVNTLVSLTNLQYLDVSGRPDTSTFKKDLSNLTYFGNPSQKAETSLKFARRIFHCFSLLESVEEGL